MGRALLFRNGTVLTADVAQPVARAVAIEDGVIVALDDEALDYASRGASEFDLAGGCLVPGFRDGHAHPLWGGIELGQVPLVGAAHDGRGRRARPRLRARPSRARVDRGRGLRPHPRAEGCRRRDGARRCGRGPARGARGERPSHDVGQLRGAPTARESTRARPILPSDASSGTATARRSAPSSSGARSRWCASCCLSPGRVSKKRVSRGR